MKKFINCEFNADLKNVIVSRGIIASFFMDEDVNINIINEVKTIVSEAVTNAIIHGYKNGEGIVGLNIDYDNKGVGIENIEEARTPLFSTGSSKERAGLGFTIMDIFSDKLEIFSKVNEGTKVAITKYIA